LLADPAACERLGAGGRRFVEQTAAPDVFAARLAAAFRNFAHEARHAQSMRDATSAKG
jgi:hypothetical protein